MQDNAPFPPASEHVYLLAIGSNRRHGKFGAPKAIVEQAISVFGKPDVQVISVARTIESRPVGPSSRTYANSALLVETSLSPRQLLAYLKSVERRFGRRRGRRWGSRVLDLDIILWGGGIWSSHDLAIPHVAFRERSFVLGPMVQLVPDWRDPVGNRTIRQLYARLSSPKPVDRRNKPL